MRDRNEENIRDIVAAIMTWSLTEGLLSCYEPLKRRRSVLLKFSKYDSTLKFFYFRVKKFVNKIKNRLMIKKKKE